MFKAKIERKQADTKSFLRKTSAFWIRWLNKKPNPPSPFKKTPSRFDSKPPPVEAQRNMERLNEERQRRIRMLEEKASTSDENRDEDEDNTFRRVETS